jgi:hypothetical protein
MPRFSLLGLFIAVAFLALGCAAMAKPSYAWASGIWTATMLVLAASLIGCFYGTRQTRAFCVGFAIFGCGHMILSLAPWFDDYTGELLFTRHMLDYVGGKLGHRVAVHEQMPGIWRNLPSSAISESLELAYLAYVVIGQSILTLAVGLLGGLIGRRLARQRPAA